MMNPYKLRKRPCFALLVLLLSGCSHSSNIPTPPPTSPNAGTCTRLEGTTGVSTQWGSGWIDLNNGTKFTDGAFVRVGIGGTAQKIVVRLLRNGEAPDLPDGALGVFDVRADRTAEAVVKSSFENVVQISVHGGPKAWDWVLGEENGPATLQYAEICH